MRPAVLVAQRFGGLAEQPAALDVVAEGVLSDRGVQALRRNAAGASVGVQDSSLEEVDQLRSLCETPVGHPMKRLVYASST